MSVFIDKHRLKVEEDAKISFSSAVKPLFYQHINEIIGAANKFFKTTDIFSYSLDCMVSNIAFSRIEQYSLKTPEIEFLRHVRNAFSHGNIFNFYNHEPKLPAKWREILIDDNAKGSSNPLFGKPCWGNLLFTEDLYILLSEIEKQLPKECFHGRYSIQD
jgi:hypothetical protein